MPSPPPPPPHPTHHTGSAVLDSAVTAFRAVTLGAAWDVGMACNIFKLQELLWPHPPDVQACTSMYAVNSCSSYTVYGIERLQCHPGKSGGHVFWCLQVCYRMFPICNRLFTTCNRTRDTKKHGRRSSQDDTATSLLDRAGIYRSHPLSTPWFAPNLNNPGRRPTVYHIHTQQGQQNREKANRIGRRPIVYREKANSIGRRPTV